MFAFWIHHVVRQAHIVAQPAFTGSQSQQIPSLEETILGLKVKSCDGAALFIQISIAVSLEVNETFRLACPKLVYEYALDQTYKTKRPAWSQVRSSEKVQFLYNRCRLSGTIWNSVGKNGRACNTSGPSWETLQ